MPSASETLAATLPNIDGATDRSALSDTVGVSSPGPLRRLVRVLLGGVLERRAGRMARMIAAEIGVGERVLDVGCGELRIGRAVASRMDVQWTGIDTVDYGAAAVAAASGDRVHFQTYRGDVLPFPPGAFDTVVLSFVLHHCDDPLRVLEESLRVAGRRLIVFEAVPRNGAELWLARPYDWLVNRLLSPDIALPFTFMSDRTLVAEFEARDLHLVRSLAVRTHPLSIVQQLMYVVEKSARPD